MYDRHLSSPTFLLATRLSLRQMYMNERRHLWHVHSPRRFNLAPEAEGFIHVEFALSCQGSENVLLQPDGLCSVPAVGWLLSARDRSSVYGTELQTRAGGLIY